MRRSASILTLAVLLSAASFSAGWWARAAQAATADRQSRLAGSITAAHTASATLQLLAEGKEAKASRLLRLQLATALEAGDQAARQGARLSEPFVPNLRLGAQRVVSYTEAQSPPGQQVKARRIAEALAVKR